MWVNQSHYRDTNYTMNNHTVWNKVNHYILGFRHECKMNISRCSLCFYLQHRGLSSVTRRCSARQSHSEGPCSVGGWNDSGSLGSPPSPTPEHTYDQTFNTTQWWNFFWRPVLGVSFHPHHDNQGYVCWSQSFKSFRPVGGPPVVEGGTSNIEPARRVDGQLPIDEVLVPFTLQHWDREEDRP